MADHRPVVSFRAAPDLHLKLEQARATFPRQQWSELFTWLLEQDAVCDLMRQRVNGD